MGLVKIWLDDERDPSEWLPHMPWMRGRDPAIEPWTWVKDAHAAVRTLESQDVDEVSLDHDLGEREDVGEGYDVLAWIEEKVHEDERYLPPILHVHTSNTGARDRMESAVGAIRRWSVGREGHLGGLVGSSPEAPGSTRPVLLVDVDGVINVPGRGEGNQRDEGFDSVFRAEGYKIRVPRGLCGRFWRLQEAFDCVWNTTWERDAPLSLAPRLGFGHQLARHPLQHGRRSGADVEAAAGEGLVRGACRCAAPGVGGRRPGTRRRRVGCRSPRDAPRPNGGGGGPHRGAGGPAARLGWGSLRCPPRLVGGRPLLLVDLDGVINVMSLGVRGPRCLEGPVGAVVHGPGHDVPGTAGDSGSNQTPGGCLRVRVGIQLEQDASALVAPHLGFGQRWPVIRGLSAGGPASTWKLRRIRRLV